MGKISFFEVFPNRGQIQKMDGLDSSSPSEPKIPESKTEENAEPNSVSEKPKKAKGIGFSMPEAHKSKESDVMDDEEAMEAEKRKKLLMTRRQSRKSIFSKEDKVAEAKEKKVLNARNHNLNRLVNKARLIGNLSKKAEANRGFANISKNDEHFNYMIKEQNNTKQEINAAVGIQMRREVLNVLHMTLDQYEKQLDKGHEITLDIEDRIACIEDDLETQRIDDDDHISGNAFAFMSKKIAGKMRNSFLPRMSSMRKSQAANAENAQEVKENFRRSFMTVKGNHLSV